MKAKGPEVEKLVAQWVDKIQNKLGGLLPKNPTEEELRLAIHPLLAEFCAEIGAHIEDHAEYALATGRADSVYNRVVIEYLRPGYLNINFDRAADSAIGQFLGYLHRLVGDEKSGIRRLAGALFDGRCIVFVQFIDGDWREDYITEVDRHTLERLLIMLSGTAPGIALGCKG